MGGLDDLPVTQWVLDKVITQPHEHLPEEVAIAYFASPVGVSAVGLGALWGFGVDEVNHYFVHPTIATAERVAKIVNAPDQDDRAASDVFAEAKANAAAAIANESQAREGELPADVDPLDPQAVEEWEAQQSLLPDGGGSQVPEGVDLSTEAGAQEWQEQQSPPDGSDDEDWVGPQSPLPPDADLATAKGIQEWQEQQSTPEWEDQAEAQDSVSPQSTLPDGADPDEATMQEPAEVETPAPAESDAPESTLPDGAGPEESVAPESTLPDGVDLSTDEAIESWQQEGSSDQASESSALPDGADVSTEEVAQDWQGDSEMSSDDDGDDVVSDGGGAGAPG